MASLKMTRKVGGAALSLFALASSALVGPVCGEFVCYERHARTAMRTFESGFRTLNGLHFDFVSNRHPEVVELVSMTQAGIFYNLTAKRGGKKLATKESERVFFD